MSKKMLAAIIGGSVIVALAIAALVIFGLQNKKETEAIKAQTAAIEAQTEAEKAAREAQAKAEKSARKTDSIQAERKHADDVRIAQAIEGPERDNPNGLCKTISWHNDDEAWETSAISREELMRLASESSYGYKVALPPGHDVTNIVGALTVDNLYSECPTQTVLWYEYSKDGGETTHLSKILVQGPVNCERLQDLRTKINDQTTCCKQGKIDDCTLLFGGKLCTTPTCTRVINPCIGKNPTRCRECGDDVGAGDGQGDGFLESKEEGDGQGDGFLESKEEPPTSTSTNKQTKSSSTWGDK